MLTTQDPACHRTLTRLKWARRQLVRANKLALHGYPVTDAASTDLRKTFAKARKALRAA